MSTPDLARRQHYGYTVRVLRDRFQASPERFTIALLVNGLTITRNLWDALGERLPEDERIPGDSMAVTAQPWANETAVVVRLPEPERITESHLVGLISRWDELRRHVLATRYFTLELAEDPTTGQRYNALCEWAPTRHLYLGTGPAEAEVPFLDAIRDVIDRSPEEAWNPAPPPTSGGT